MFYAVQNIFQRYAKYKHHDLRKYIFKLTCLNLQMYLFITKCRQDDTFPDLKYCEILFKYYFNILFNLK